MSTVGIVFSNVHDKNISQLTSRRTMASVPFGCRYRLIDFTLSNMVNSGIQTVGVITHYNYQSLMDHLGTGKDWDLASRSGGIKILPPNITAFDGTTRTFYASRLEALKGALSFITHRREDYVVLSDCDIICNIDLRDITEYHIKTGADITIATKKMQLTPENTRKNVIVNTDANNRITDVSVYPTNAEGEYNVSLNIMIMRRDFLKNVIIDATAHGYTSFNSDIIAKNIHSLDIRSYPYEGYFACLSSLSEYFACSMALLNCDVRHALFGIKERPVFTKVRNSAPTRYSETSSVSNSLIADGCIIEGTVENSILFRGVQIAKGALIKNSVILQDSYIGSYSSLNCIITDKNVLIKDRRTLSGYVSNPFYIEKGSLI